MAGRVVVWLFAFAAIASLPWPCAPFIALVGVLAELELEDRMA